MRTNAEALVLLITGTVAALYFGKECIEALIALESAPVVEFAIASLLAVIGWRELTATDESY